MRWLLDIYRSQFKVTMVTQMQYRVAMVIWLIGMVLEPVIYLVVWTNVAQASGGSVGSYTGGDFAAYFIVMMMVNHATFTWIMHEYDFRVRTGAFSPLLLKPVHPIHKDIADNIAYKLLTLVVMVPAAIILSLVFHPTFTTEPWAVLLFIPALVLAFLVRFLVEWTLAMAAFWTTRVGAINQMYFVVSLFLAGQMAPLALLPYPLQVLASILPFRWMVAFPVELLAGRLSISDALIGLGAQAVWLILSLVLLALIWRTGVRRYSAVGS